MGVQACALPVSGRGRIRAAARAIAVIRVMGLLLGAGLPVEAQAGIGGGAGAGLVQGAFGRGARGDAGAGDVSLVGQVAGVEKDRTVQAVEGEIPAGAEARSEEHTSELQSLMRISYAVFCLQNKKTTL